MVGNPAWSGILDYTDRFITGFITDCNTYLIDGATLERGCVFELNINARRKIKIVLESALKVAQ